MTLEELKAECDERGIKYHHKAGKKKLKELLEEVTVTLDREPSEEELETINKEHSDTKVNLKVIPKYMQVDFKQPDYRKAWREFNEVLTMFRGSGAEFLIVGQANPEEALNKITTLPNKVVGLSLYHADYNQWTSQSVKKVGDYMDTGWLDGTFIVKRALAEACNWSIPQPKQWNPNNKSNGVGGYLSRIAINNGYKLYHL